VGEIEAPQGYAFISDTVEDLDDEMVTKMASAALPYAEQVVKILKNYSSKIAS
jgi:hypothetical protein